MRVPFCPLPLEKAKMASRIFYGLGERLAKAFPKLKAELKQAEMPVDEKEYLSIALFTSTFVLFVSFVPLAAAGAQLLETQKALSLASLFGLLIAALTFFYIKAYPKLIIKRAMADLDRNLLFALRHLYVQVKAGVPLFDAIVSVSNGGYGAVSRTLKKALKEINAGTPVGKALDDMALMNPSPYFRRAVWQLSHSIKSGSDIGATVRALLENLSAEQRIAIRRYGSQLNPLTLVYMMMAVIVPTLGITFLIVLSMFSGISVSERMLWIIFALLVLFQFMFLGIIKSRRPNIL